MKNMSILMALAVLGAMTSCSQDEPAEIINATKGHEIDFRPGIGTRATETTNANLTSMNVTAFLPAGNALFESVDFSKGADGYFTSAEKYYWPGDDSEVSFYSYSPSSVADYISLASDKKQIVDFSVDPEIAGQIDLLTSKASGKKSVNESAGVEMTFKHRLSEIELRAKTDNTNYIYKVVGARIGRAQYAGTFDFDTEAWTLDDWHDTEVYTTSCDTVTLSSTPVTLMGASGNAMLMPQTLNAWMPTSDPDNVTRSAYLSVLIQISTAKTGAVVYPYPSDSAVNPATGKKYEYRWASIPLSGTWEQGKKYIYTLDFTDGAGYVDPDDPTPGKPVLGGEMKFTVNVEDWVNSSNDKPMTVKPEYK